MLDPDGFMSPRHSIKDKRRFAEMLENNENKNNRDYLMLSNATTVEGRIAELLKMDPELKKTYELKVCWLEFWGHRDNKFVNPFEKDPKAIRQYTNGFEVIQTMDKGKGIVGAEIINFIDSFTLSFEYRPIE